MEFIVENFVDYKFNLTLITDIQNLPRLHELDQNDNIVILNPELVNFIFMIDCLGLSNYDVH